MTKAKVNVSHVLLNFDILSSIICIFGTMHALSKIAQENAFLIELITATKNRMTINLPNILVV